MTPATDGPRCYMEKIMSKPNDTSKLGPATQVRELRSDELLQVSGGYTFTDVMVESFRGKTGPAKSSYFNFELTPEM
jgi:hypothetical protein